MAAYPTCPKTIRKGGLPRKTPQFSLDADLLWSHRWYSRLSFSQWLGLAGVNSLWLGYSYVLYCGLDS